MRLRDLIYKYYEGYDEMTEEFYKNQNKQYLSKKWVEEFVEEILSFDDIKERRNFIKNVFNEIKED